MGSVLDVLHEHGLTASEALVAQELRALLDAPPAETITLTAAEEEFLDAHSGISRASAGDLDRLAARSEALAIREAATGLSRSEVAQRLGIAESRVSHRVRSGSLYSYAGAGGRPRYPSWQFIGGTVVPHLAEILPRIPDGTHPVTLRTFMTTPDDGLLLDDVPSTPVSWLTNGGAPEPVAALAETLGEQP